MSEMKCKYCGCTDENACEGGCSWVAKDVCSKCAVKLIKVIEVDANGKYAGPGSNNYPREPDEPAVAYFECIECAGKDKELLVKVLKDKSLNQIQTDLLSSFLVGHWKEISQSEHRVAFERILETLNPGALRAVKRLRKECEHGRNPDLCMYCHPELGKGGDRDESEVIGTMLCDPGEHNYPHSPDEPGGLYFECNACAAHLPKGDMI